MQEAARTEAEKRRSAAEAWRQEAVALGALTVAKESAAAAEAAERRAVNALASGDYALAAAAYQEAERAYLQAIGFAKKDAERLAGAALAEMVEAKRRADEANARTYAPDEYDAAEKLEKTAAATLAARDALTATRQYEVARAAYEKAEQAARAKSTDPAFQSAMVALRAMEASKAACGSKPANPQYFSWGQQTEAKGRDDLKALRYARAEKSFKDAKLFYDKAGAAPK